MHFRWRFFAAACLAVALLMTRAFGQPFVHPGGLHDRQDLERMRQKVVAGAHPWIDGWEKLCQDPLARFDYKATPNPNMGVSRQRASRDAHAAYLNTIRWYISGDDRFADCAIRICNEWSAAVNQVPRGTDIPGLSGIPIAEFALVGEILRICPRWQGEDFDRFKRMMRTYWYPNVHEFLAAQNGPGNTRYWANWNICNIGACLAIGVLLDDREIFNEGLKYFHSDLGTGSIRNAVYFMHPGGLGQWQESGRDQPHAQLGLGLMAQLCEVAWKQGIDLYGAENNRLLAGAEYIAQWDMWRPVPYKHYTNSDRANQSWPSINGRGRLNRPVWELLYNHYVVRKGLEAPNTTAFAKLVRVEAGSIDHFGYGTLTFTLDAERSPFPPSPVPPPPTQLSAQAGVNRVFLRWQRSGDTAQGYEVRRATAAGGPFDSVASWADNTRCEHTDTGVKPGTTYFYHVAARNQAGTSQPCDAASATPAEAGDLPAGWTRSDIGGAKDSSAGFADVSGGTFVVRGAGSGIGRTSDSVCFVNTGVSGDVMLTARLSNVAWARDGRNQKVGIMIRQSLEPDSPLFLMKLGDVGARQAGAGLRKESGGAIVWTGGNDYTWIPAWFRLQRVGDRCIAYESSDGQRWFEVTKADLPLRGDYRIGLFVSAGGESVNTTHFDHVSLTR
jgi:hypothetical protein